MTRNSNDPEHVQGARDRENSSMAAAAIVPQPTDNAQPIARPVPVVTVGRTEFAARCPGCGGWHRHIGLGEKTGPCGTSYLLAFKNKLKGAA